MIDGVAAWWCAWLLQVIVDTAGRQVLDDRLMSELKSIKSAVKPTEVLLVVDAMTGQEAATVTARFNDDIGITGTRQAPGRQAERDRGARADGGSGVSICLYGAGAILTKLDGDTRGGAALSVRGVSGKPIKVRATMTTPTHPLAHATRWMGGASTPSLR